MLGGPRESPGSGLLLKLHLRSGAQLPSPEHHAMLRLERDDPLEVSIGLLGLILVDPGDPVVGPGRVLSDRLDKEPILPRPAQQSSKASGPSTRQPNNGLAQSCLLSSTPGVHEPQLARHKGPVTLLGSEPLRP